MLQKLVNVVKTGKKKLKKKQQKKSVEKNYYTIST